MTTPELGGSPSRPGWNEAASERVQEEVRQLNLTMPVDMHREMRMWAVQQDITRRELRLNALVAYLAT